MGKLNIYLTGKLEGNKILKILIMILEILKKH